MSFLRLSRTYLRPTTRLLLAQPQRAAFSFSATRSAGKESAVHEDSEKRAEEAEYHKQDQLQKQKEGKNTWKEEIASDSESAIKADREGVEDAGKDTERLQQETANAPSKKHGQ